jgi:response regulator of citrate/malate metabolism
VVSGYASRDVVRTAVQLGVVDYLVKPFWPARLTEALESFAARACALRDQRRLNQEEVDRARIGAQDVHHGEREDAERRRVEQVRDVLGASGVAMTAGDVASSTGMARVTARRYLERLVASGQCTVDQLSDGPGRPRKMYRLWLDRPIGSPPRASRVNRLA